MQVGIGWSIKPVRTYLNNLRGKAAMCGYVRRHIGPKDLQEFLSLIGMAQLQFRFPEDGKAQHFYPAFGGVPERTIQDLVIREDGKLKTVDATWWYGCEEAGDSLRVITSPPTFNARNLHLKTWREPIRYRRGIAIGTAIGEAIMKDGVKRQFFAQSDKPLLLGCLYQKFPNGRYSCAVITRDAHPRFKNYHDDAFPMMLPPDPKLLDAWLSESIPEDDPVIVGLLGEPRIYSDLTVTPVKTYKDAVPKGDPVTVAADDWAVSA